MNNWDSAAQPLPLSMRDRIRAGLKAPTSLQTLLIAIVFIILYVTLSGVSQVYPTRRLAISLWEPQSGLTIAFGLLFGLRYWPAITLAVLFSMLALRPLTFPLGYHLASALFVIAGYLAMIALLMRSKQFDLKLENMKSMWWFVMASLIVPAIVAVVFVGLYIGAGLMEPAAFWRNAARFWVGNVIGMVVLTPFCLTWGLKLRRGCTNAHLPLGEVTLQGLTVLATLWIVFVMDIGDQFNLFYLLFLPLIWIAIRHGLAGATLALLAIQAGVVASSELRSSSSENVMQLQLLLLALALTGLFLGVSATERRKIATELRVRQVELERAQQFAAAGEMATAIAHELNQPLSAIATYAQSSKILASQKDTSTALLETLDKTVAEVRRSAEIIQRVRDFFQGRVLRPIPVAADTLAADALLKLEPYLQSKRISVRCLSSGEIPKLHVDKIQVDIVLQNLLRNACDAIPAAGANARLITLHIRLDEAENVRFSVADSGPGVSGFLRDHLFDTLVSGKSKGMGIGLGLSRSIIEAHGGRLWLQSSNERGSEFCFTLPTASRGDARNDHV